MPTSTSKPTSRCGTCYGPIYGNPDDYYARFVDECQRCHDDRLDRDTSPSYYAPGDDE